VHVSKTVAITGSAEDRLHPPPAALNLAEGNTVINAWSL
jgi:hypothetical protein